VGVACRHLGQYSAEARNSWNCSPRCAGGGALAGLAPRGDAPGAAPCFVGVLLAAGAPGGRRAIGKRMAGF
jgi:hypothetical protein